MLVNVSIDVRSRPNTAVGLLAPIPFDRPTQSFVGFEKLPHLAQHCWPITDGPACYLLRETSLDLTLRMRYGPGDEKLPKSIFDQSPQSPQEKDVIFDSWLPDPPKNYTAYERAERVVNDLAQRFQYGARNADIAADAQSLGLLIGNCIDINTVLLHALRRADVRSAYLAGYYFAALDEPANGMHCWVATLTETGFCEWDVAHALQAGTKQISPFTGDGLGARVVVSHGRKLAYSVEGVTYLFDHLVQPHWLLPDGTTEVAPVTTTLSADIPISAI